MKVEDVNPREAFRMIGEDIDRDIKFGTFGAEGTESLSWLMKEPTNAEETLMNAYERLRSLGIKITLTANHGEISLSDILKAAAVRSKASGNPSMQ
ncbi:hypothetical protein SEA_ZION_43 [Corynebacterium phage Zion]|uniref:Uncharacterized protein n=3 Tax=Corynebacterium virus Zion TaxID=2560397 RepID=A0A2H4P8V1_9CAUD|nr:hypothetical protein FDJ12_gp43 [Corynebacterium phage Zion]ATW58681.1 hypothetical protein SEA_POTATOCHIP_43 [Corynebacterium phage PotatoChip]ATW58789.1 hypothetical protein SEA_ZION_43 [Corynebacterium phage Zion]AYR03346.1 hypothetical protein PETEYPAB_42 [Corynebacterium phage PeteyPab]